MRDQSEVEVTSTQSLTFEAWKDSVRVRGKKDIYIVGEKVTPVALVGEQEARGFFDKYVGQSTALILHNGQTQPGAPAPGSRFPARPVLRYCIDRTGLEQVVARHTYLPSGTDLYPIVDATFGAAAAAWNSAAGTIITKVIDRDRSCSPQSSDDITWYIRPYFVNDPATIEYLSFVLHPHQNALGPAYRELLIFEDVLAEFSSPHPMPFGDWFSLEGLMAHTIASGLGFLSEATRGGRDTNLWPESCQDPSVGGQYYSDPDPFSVTTHPQVMADDGALNQPACAGFRPFDYAISYRDAMAASCAYRGENILYYCAIDPQETIAKLFAPECSPVPLVAGDSDCQQSFDFTSIAAEAATAMLTAIQHGS
jgi:hypothetical protein